MSTSSDSGSDLSLEEKSEPENDTRNNKPSVFQMQHLGFDMQKRQSSTKKKMLSPATNIAILDNF